MCNEAQGPEGKMLERHMQAVFEHWRIPVEQQTSVVDQDNVQSAVPISTFTVKVKYRYVGEMKPLQYPDER
jgi:hypothetical protein